MSVSIADTVWCLFLRSYPAVAGDAMSGGHNSVSNASSVAAGVTEFAVSEAELRHTTVVTDVDVLRWRKRLHRSRRCYTTVVATVTTVNHFQSNICEYLKLRASLPVLSPDALGPGPDTDEDNLYLCGIFGMTRMSRWCPVPDASCYRRIPHGALFFTSIFFKRVPAPPTPFKHYQYSTRLFRTEF